MDLDAEKTRPAGFLTRAVARRGQQPAEQFPGRPERQSCLRGLGPGAGRDGQHRRGRAGAEPSDLPVAEPAAVGPALHGVAAAHHAGVDPGHKPRAGPHPQLIVVPGPVQVALVAQAGFGRAIGAERIRVLHEPAALGAGPNLIQLPHHRGQRPAAEPAPHRRHHERRIQQVTGTVGAGGVMQQQHPQVGRNRVEPAAVHDPRTRTGGRVVAAVDAVPDEQHLTGQVRVIGARLGAGLNQREPAGTVGPHRGDHHPGRPRQRPQRHRIGQIGNQQRPGRRSGAQPGPDLRQPPLRTPRKADPHIARRMSGQVTSHQPPGEPGGAEHHDIELTVSAHQLILGKPPPAGRTCRTTRDTSGIADKRALRVRMLMR
jgi:hypothetical protein